ncbi:MAG: hypothetical protein LBM75_01575 [Myxococcales bacterium]|jgi:hypothetical protein|nr:hypothetical protein [Myxococcales bacterium]
MKLKILYHDGCFDGASSAAIFTRFYREHRGLSAKDTIDYLGLSHAGSKPLAPELFDGDVNAMLDFRYATSDRLTWWFDHHASSFPNPGEEAYFRADTSGQKFHDPAAKSCTRFMARTLHERFGFDTSPVEELIHWAEIIDGALFPDPSTAVRLGPPALKLMLVIEASPGPGFIPRLIGDLQSCPFAELVELPYVAERLGPIYECHLEIVELVRSRLQIDRGVVFYDVADRNLSSINKFIPYEMFPEARYTVAVSRGPSRAKISVGSNPWFPERRTHDLARICERFGGGGHPVVGAVSYPCAEVDRARADADAIVRELQDDWEAARQSV